MNRLKMSLAVLLLACAQAAHANSDPVSVETKWNEKSVSFTTTSVTAAAFDVAGFGADGFAILGHKYIANGVDGTAPNASITVSSATKNAVLFDYNFLAQGSTGTFKLAQTVKTPPPSGTGIKATTGFNSPAPTDYLITAPVISTSAAISMPSGVLVQQTMRAQVVNPVFILSGLLPSSTYTFTVNYGVPALQ